jgi:Tol biopolymer transport system component
MNTNGANRRVVAQVTNQQDYLAPEYAPNNGRIAFEGLTHGANGRIQKSDLLVRSVGGRTTNITANKPASFSEPSWAPNGQKLVAIRGQGTLVSMNPNGSDVRVLTTVPPAETSIVGAVYSPDGKKIAYVQCIGGIGDCDDPGFHAKGSIWVMNADGSGNHRVFRGRAVQPGGRLSWQSL